MQPPQRAETGQRDFFFALLSAGLFPSLLADLLPKSLTGSFPDAFKDAFPVFRAEAFPAFPVIFSPDSLEEIFPENSFSTGVLFFL